MMKVNFLKCILLVLLYVSVRAFEQDHSETDLVEQLQKIYDKNPVASPYKLGPLEGLIPILPPIRKECNDTMNGMLNDLQVRFTSNKKLTPEEQLIIDGSGILPQQFGKMRSCTANPNLTYYFGYWMNVKDDDEILLQLYTGVCMPKVCNAEDTGNQYQPLANSMPPILTPKWVLRFVEQSTLKQKVNETRPAFFWWYFIIVGVLTLFAIYATIANQCKKARKSSYSQVATLQTNYGQSTIVGNSTGISDKTDDKFQSRNNLKDTKDSILQTKNKRADKPKTDKVKDPLDIKTKPTMKVNLDSAGASESVWSQVLEAFDFVERMPTLMVSKRPSPESGAFDLIRNLSMAWVIIAHQFAERITASVEIINHDNMLKNVAHDPMITFIEHGFYAVDFFLFMGGYVAILSLKSTVDKFRTSAFWKWPILYIFLLIKRYIRILPILGIIVQYRAYVYVWLSPENPTNFIWLNIINVIPHSTWRDWNLVYSYDKISSYVISCGWFWYLVVDYQCFMIIPLILMSMWIHKNVALIICGILILTSVTYTMIISYDKFITLDPLNAGWNNEYYFFWPCRMCVYFMGSAVGIITTKPAGRTNKRVETAIPVNKLNTPDQSFLNTTQNYEIIPNKTYCSIKIDRTKKQHTSNTNYILGITSGLIVVLSFILMNQIFQVGNDLEKAGRLLNALWLTFGKIIFVVAAMILLIQICKTNPRIPKAIANNAPIQQIGNLSFSMYGWHYIVLYYSISCAESDANFPDYMFVGAFWWVFFFTFILALWTAQILEYPLSDLWRLIEKPILKKLV